MLFKDKKNKLYVGYDLGERFSQISYLNMEKEEPVTVSTVSGEEQFNIPTVLCKRQEVNQWFYGKEAVRQAQLGEGLLISNLIESAKKKEDICVEGEYFNANQLLALFVKKSLSLLNLEVDFEKLEGFMITVEQLDHEMVLVLNEIVRLLGIQEDKVTFQSHTESFYQFMIHQPEELWRHKVVVCDYASEYMKIKRLETNKKTSPIVVFVDDKEVIRMPFSSDKLKGELTTDQEDMLDDTFLNMLKLHFNEQIINTCYLIGEGFSGNWCKESLKFLCKNRRVFQGNNLYSKGSSYGARSRFSNSLNNEKYVFLGNQKVKANIGMKMEIKGIDQYFPILDAGINWYEGKKEWDVILDSGNKLVFIITPLKDGQKKLMEMTLDELVIRPNRTTRLHICVVFLSETTIQIQVSDLGFGQFFPSSGKVWTEELDIS